VLAVETAGSKGSDTSSLTENREVPAASVIVRPAIVRVNALIDGSCRNVQDS
jgi:hypothetical protein